MKKRALTEFEMQDAAIMWRAGYTRAAKVATFCIGGIWWAWCWWWADMVWTGIVPAVFFALGCWVTFFLAPASRVLRCWAGLHPDDVPGWRKASIAYRPAAGRPVNLWVCPSCGEVTDRRRSLSIPWEGGRRG